MEPKKERPKIKYYPGFREKPKHPDHALLKAINRQVDEEEKNPRPKYEEPKMFLTEGELIELTGRQRRPSQLMALRYMGIEHKVRPDATIAVLRSHVEKEFGGIVKSDKPREAVIDWSTVR